MIFVETPWVVKSYHKKIILPVSMRSIWHYDFPIELRGESDGCKKNKYPPITLESHFCLLEHL